MFWVGLATLIMMLNGSGDDTLEFRNRSKAMDKAIQKLVSDSHRQTQAKAALAATMKAFIAHRKRLDVVAKCIAKADTNYHATRADYQACTKNLAHIWEQAKIEFVAAESDFRAAVTPEELKNIEQEVMSK